MYDLPVTVISKPVKIYENKIIKDIALVIQEGIRIYLKRSKVIRCKKCDRTFQHGIKTQFCIYCGNDLTDDVAKEIAEIMYGIYNKDLSLRHWFNDIYVNERNIAYAGDMIRLNNLYQSKLVAATGILKMHEPQHFFLEKDTYWIRVWPTEARNLRFKRNIINNLKKRIYLNVDPQYFDTIVGSLVAIIANGVLKQYRDKIMFKFVNPLNPHLSEHLIRAEKIVVYYSNEQLLHNALVHWVTSKSKMLRPHAPLFTTEIVPGAGYAYEPLPEHHTYHEIHSGGVASFGTFITLNVGRYLYGWILKHKKIPNNLEILQIAKDAYYHKLKVKHLFPGV